MKNNVANYTTSNQTLKSGKVSTTVVGNMKLSWVGSNIGDTRLTHECLMARNYQQPTCPNAACRNQSLTIKHCLVECPNGGTQEKKYPELHKNATGKALWSWKGNKVP